MLDAAEALEDGSADGHDEVLDAASSAFLEFGIRRTSMGEIARRAGVSPASLYRWFGSKEAVVAALVARDLRRFTADLEDAADPHAPPVDQLTDLVLAVGRKLVSEPLLHRLIRTEPETVLPQLTVEAGPLIELGVGYLAAQLERFMDDGHIERFDPVPVSEIFIRLFHSLILTPASSFPFDDEERLRTLARSTISGLLRLPPPSEPPPGGTR